MALHRLDVLHVRTFNERSSSRHGPQGSRVIIDFDEDPGTDRFMLIDNNGAFLCIGTERLQLGWDALVQLTDLLGVARKTLKPR
jgi:hypothetical protein